MNYQDAKQYIFEDLPTLTERIGAESTAELLAHHGNPHEDIEYIQIGGTNGKGSTSKMVATILQEEGYSVGLNTSPHLEDPCERIRVEGEKIPQHEFCGFVEQSRQYITDLSEEETPTFAEVMTAMALWYFGRQGIDFGVLEVGAGGAYDPTSAVDPIASAVTNSDLDHVGAIGDTLEEIARGQATVALNDTPLVTGATGTALENVREVAGDVIRVGQSDSEVTVSYQHACGETKPNVSISLPDRTIESTLSMIGPHQAINAGIAVTLVELAADVSDAAIQSGLEHTQWPGRFEILDDDPMVVVDGAHNEAGCKALAETVGLYEYNDLVLVYGSMMTKEHQDMIPVLPDADKVVICEPDSEYAEPTDELAPLFEQEAVSSINEERTARSGLLSALDRAEKDDLLLVTGSLSTVSEARKTYETLQTPRE